MSTKNLIALFQRSFESYSLLKRTNVQLTYNSRSDGVYTTSLATASKSARIKGAESSRQDSIGSKEADINASADFCSFGLQISILSPMKVICFYVSFH